MKAAVISKFGDIPQYQNFPDPTPGDGDVVIQVKAVVLENFDKMTAKGIHYASKLFPQFPAIVRHSGVGTWKTRRWLLSAERSLHMGRWRRKRLYRQYKGVTPIPAAWMQVSPHHFPASALTSLLPLRWRVTLQPSETVLINGATGISGKLAV